MGSLRVRQTFLATAAACGLAVALPAGATAAEATFGFSGWAVGYLPTAIAIERLNEMGHDIEIVELGGNSNQLQAAASGAIDITVLAQVMDAIDQGFDSRMFMAANTNEFLMVGRAELEGCDSLAGQDVAIHSVSSFVGQLTLQWMEAECPDVEANILVIEGSENRLAALLAGQIDASPVDLQDWALLQRERPGEFAVTEDFTESVPILRAAFAAQQSFIAENPDLIRDWISVHLDVYQEIYENPQLLIDKGEELLGEIDPEVLPDIVNAFIEARIWPTDGDLSDESVQQTIDFFNNDGEPYATIESPDDVVDRTLLDEVLANR
ncbi:MAG: ABC transporter substrate-binding protein [Azospirillaceae bacterium]